MKPLILAIGALTAMSAGPVAAADLGDFKAACKGRTGPLPVEAVLGVILTESRTPWSPAIIAAYSRTVDASSVGTRLAEIEDTDTALAMVNYTADIIDAALRPPVDGISVTVVGRRDGETGEGMRLALDYLRGNVRLLTVNCPLPNQNASTQGAVPRPGTARTPRPLVVAGDIASVSSPFDKRTFATLGYTDNRLTDTDFIYANLVLGLAPTGDTTWVPHLSYQRRTDPARSLNDLSLGVTGFWRGRGHEVRWTGAYETDDNLESAVYRAQVEWEFPTLPFCDDRFSDRPPRYMTCFLGVRADYAEVADPGDKVALTTLGEYARIGAWADIAYGWGLAHGLWVQATARIDIMESLNGAQGDVQRMRIGLDVLPGKSSNFKFGLSYEDGEDITSLTPTRMFKASLGFRY